MDGVLITLMILFSVFVGFGVIVGAYEIVSHVIVAQLTRRGYRRKTQ